MSLAMAGSNSADAPIVSARMEQGMVSCSMHDYSARRNKGNLEVNMLWTFHAFLNGPLGYSPLSYLAPRSQLPRRYLHRSVLHHKEV